MIVPAQRHGNLKSSGADLISLGYLHVERKTSSIVGRQICERKLVKSFEPNCRGINNSIVMFGCSKMSSEESSSDDGTNEWGLDFVEGMDLED